MASFQEQPYEIRIMIFKEARRTAFKEKIDRFNIVYLDMIHKSWTDDKLWRLRQHHDRRSAQEVIDEQAFWANHNNGVW